MAGWNGRGDGRVGVRRWLAVVSFCLTDPSLELGTEAAHSMDSSEDRVWFMGDLSDPWVVTIADAVPAALRAVRVDCAGDLPERPFEPARRPRLIILHRHRLTSGDAQRLLA